MTAEPAAVARRYFDAITRRDLDAAASCWAPGGIDHLVPVGELEVPDAWREYFESLFAAMPDFRYDVLEVVAEGDRAVVHWRTSGTFTGSPFQGILANGARVETLGLDLVRVAGGLIQRNDSYWDDASVARQIGLLPARLSRNERVLTALFNCRTRVAGLPSLRTRRRGRRSDGRGGQP